MYSYGPSFKKLGRMIEKTFRCYKTRFGELSDILRASLVYSTLHDVLHAADLLLRLSLDPNQPFSVRRMKNRLTPEFDANNSGGCVDALQTK